MKPKDLKYPFSFENRIVCLQDSVLFVPDFLSDYDKFTFPGWEELFGNSNPVCVEYCSGNGAWVLDRALKYPDINWVAVEKRFDRVRKIWSKKKNSSLDNLFIVFGEAKLSSYYFFPKETVDSIYVNFPDPWPKERHKKNRLIQSPFVSEMDSILKTGGKIMIVTDDIPYSEQIVETMLKSGRFESEYPSPYFVTELEEYGTSWFEDLWREKGKKIHYHSFIKREKCEL